MKAVRTSVSNLARRGPECLAREIVALRRERDDLKHKVTNGPAELQQCRRALEKLALEYCRLLQDADPRDTEMWAILKPYYKEAVK